MATKSTTITVPSELKARYDAATITDNQIAAYWKAQESDGATRAPGYPIASIDRKHPDADRRLFGPKDFPEFEHLTRLAKARKDHTAAQVHARIRVDSHAPCQFCGRREPSANPGTYVPALAGNAPGCVSCSPRYAAIMAEETAKASAAVLGVDAEQAMRDHAAQVAAAYVAAREASWVRQAADPNPLPTA